MNVEGGRGTKFKTLMLIQMEIHVPSHPVRVKKVSWQERSGHPRGSGLVDPLQRNAPDAQPVQRPHLAVASAVAEQQRITGEVHGDIVVNAIGVTLDQLALRPRLATISGNSGHQRVAPALWERESAGMIIEER